MSLLQTNWAALINPLLKNPLSKGIFLPSISLVTGNNVINHLLGRKQQGWLISDQDAAASIYRSQPFNDITLTLNSSANCVVTLYVF